MRLVLASQSPRRAELLDQMALNFEVVVTDID
ncbi:MAG: putative house-cleaning NTP pyrophosphatase (Maf/HAM1 superfamily), partial [Limisphaerales bacterium]